MYRIDRESSQAAVSNRISDVGEGATRLDTLRGLLTDGVDALYRYIYYRIGADTSAAEDVLHQTVEVALGHANLPVTREEQEGWLRGVAKNLIRRHWRVSRREPLTETDSAGANGLSLPAFASKEPQPDSRAIRRESMDQLMRAVSGLSADEQWLLYAFYRHGQTRAQIARTLGVTEKSVQSRLYRMRVRLREMIETPEGMLQ